MITPKNVIDLYYELSRYIFDIKLPIRQSKKKYSKKEINKLKSYIEHTGFPNPLINYMKPFVGFDLRSYISLVKLGYNDSDKKYIDMFVVDFDDEIVIPENIELHNLYSPFYMYLFCNGKFESYIRKLTKVKFRKRDYDYFIKHDKETKTKMGYLEDTGYWKYFKTFGYIWDNGLRDLISNGSKGR